MINFLIIDLECTCDEQSTIPREEMEIIEIGAILGAVDSLSFSTLSEYRTYIKPTIHPKLTAFCTNLTGISQETVDGAQPLSEALISFQHWLSDVAPRAWGSWGKFDTTQFKMECSAKNLLNPLERYPHHNLKQLFARKRGHRVGLARALQLSSMEFEGRHHSGLDDAKNVGRVLARDDLVRTTLLAKLNCPS